MWITCGATKAPVKVVRQNDASKRRLLECILAIGKVIALLCFGRKAFRRRHSGVALEVMAVTKGKVETLMRTQPYNDERSRFVTRHTHLHRRFASWCLYPGNRLDSLRRIVITRDKETISKPKSQSCSDWKDTKEAC